MTIKGAFHIFNEHNRKGENHEIIREIKTESLFVIQGIHTVLSWLILSTK